MAKILTTTRQHTPTVDAYDNPTCCYVCGMRAVALGINPSFGRGNADPHFICKRCAMGISDYTKIRRLDDYELKALDYGVDAIGEYLDTIGIYDLALMDDLNRKMIAKAAWEGCADGLRKLLEDGGAPF